MINYYKILTEAGIEVPKQFTLLSEASQLKVTEDELTGMMKFIADKYNALDFEEIEKSAGDIARFKYAQMIHENVNMLKSIYMNSPDPGSDKYLKVVNSILTVYTWLEENRRDISDLYKSGNGIVQLTYTSLVAAVLYAVGILVSNTIRFVTTDKDAECEVLFDEIPGTIKHVHIKNIVTSADHINDFTKLIKELKRPSAAINESITVTIPIAILGIGTLIVLIPRIIILLREIIYSIYFTRVRVSDMLTLQADLIRTNIESLEQGRGNKKVIARQRKIAEKLEKWKNRIAIKVDSAEVLKNTQQKKENLSLRIEKDSPLMTNNFDTSDGLLL